MGLARHRDREHAANAAPGLELDDGHRVVEPGGHAGRRLVAVAPAEAAVDDRVDISRIRPRGDRMRAGVAELDLQGPPLAGPHREVEVRARLTDRREDQPDRLGLAAPTWPARTATTMADAPAATASRRRPEFLFMKTPAIQT
jgi:hypothetical protein